MVPLPLFIRWLLIGWLPPRIGCPSRIPGWRFASFASALGDYEGRRPTRHSHWPVPTLTQKNKDHVVGNKQCRHPESRYPIGGPHIRRCTRKRGQRNHANQIDGPCDVEEPDERSCEPRPADDCRDCDKCQDGGEQVAECRWICELLGDAGQYGAWSEEHQAEVPQSVQQKNWEHDGTRLELGKIWDQIELGCYRKDDRAEQQVDGQDVHLRLSPLTRAHFSGRLGRILEIEEPLALSGVQSRTEPPGSPAARCHPDQISPWPKRSRPCASQGLSRTRTHDD